MFPNNMNDVAINGSMVEPANGVPPSPDPEKKPLPWKLILAVGGGVLVLIILIVVVVALTSGRRSTTANYEIPRTEEVEYSSATTTWLGNYFFSIPETLNFTVGMDDPYEAIYLTRSGETRTSTEIAYLDDITFETVKEGGVINSYVETLKGYLDATDSKFSATRVNGIEFYYMDFMTADGRILFAFSAADDSAFLTVVTGGDGETVEARLADSVSVLLTAKEMNAADKGVADDVGDVVNAGALLEDLREL